jgi:hypothetical protein
MVSLGGDEYYYNGSFSLLGGYDFYVWAVDGGGNWNWSDVWVVMRQGFEEGWNLVTVPVGGHGWTAETLGQQVSGCNLVLRFNASTQGFETYVVGSGYDDFPLLDGVGYFARVPSDTVLSCGGMSMPSVNVTVYEDWNTLGWFYEYPSSAQSLGENTGASLVLMFNATTQNFMTYVMNSGYDNFIISRGMGVFIQASESGWWHGEG